MKQRKQDFALGMTAIVVLGVFLGTILFIYPALQARGRTVQIHFRHEVGMAPLKRGSAVLLGGSLEVGRVRDVRIVQEPDPNPPAGRQRTVFVVEAELRRNFPLYGNCEITTDQPAIGGSGFVTIISVGTPGVPLPRVIEGQPPQSFAATLGTLSRRLLGEGGIVDHIDQALDPNRTDSAMHKVLISLDDVNSMTRSLRTQLNPEEQKTLLNKFHLILDDLNATTAILRHQMTDGDQEVLLEKLHIALDRLGEGLTEATAMLKEDRPLVKDALTNAEHATRIVDREMLTVLQSELDPANPASLLGKVHAAMNSVNVSLAEVQSMTSTGERMVAVSRPRLEKIMDNFQAMSEQLNQTSLEVLLNPSILLTPPSPQRREQLVVFEAARAFAGAASQLDAATGRLDAVLKTLPESGKLSEADNQELQAIHDAVRAAFQRFEQAEQVLWEKMK